MALISCVACLQENPVGGAFCGFCGEKLLHTCANCGALMPAAFRFCGQCGVPVPGPHPKEEITRTQVVDADTTVRAERRQVTVLFADLVGSTQLSRQLDPEDLRELIGLYRTITADAVSGFSGEVSRYIGDGIVAFFGFPIARENDAAAAVHAGLAIVAGVDRAAGTFQARFGVVPHVRIGIHTGLVVAGDLASGLVFERMSVVGETPNIAARIQEAAKPDTVMIGPTTARLVSRYVELRSTGLCKLKGLDEDFELFEALRGDSSGFRLQRSAEQGWNLEGRDEELRLLLDLWRRTEAGSGQVVLVEADAGLGKSRLLKEVQRRLEVEAAGASWFDWLGSPFTSNTPFAPVAQALWRALDLEELSNRHLLPERLSALLAGVLRSVPEAVELVAELLEDPLPDAPLTHGWSPARRRHRLLEALTGWIIGEAARAPCVLAIEDLQWMDPSTRELAGLVSRQVTAAPLLILATTRTGHQTEWLNESNVHLIRLHPLSGPSIDLLIQSIAARHSLPPAVIDAIARKSDGVPLFAEELTRNLMERWSEAGEVDAIPDTLRDALMERLDRHPLARTRIEAAAVLGRNFGFRDLLNLLDCDADELAETLEAVSVAGIIIPSGFPPDATYMFKHSLIRDAAYDSLLLRSRRELHRKAAERAALDPETTWPAEQIARHFSEAGMPQRAFTYYLQAAEEAHRGEALKEALAGFDAALAELMREPPGTDRDELELKAQIGRGAVLLAARGYGSQEVRSTYEHASALARRSDHMEASFASLWGLSSFFAVAGPGDRAAEIGDLMIATAIRMDDPFNRAEAERRRGLIAFTQGEFGPAHRYYQAAETHIAQARDPDALLFGTRPSSLLRNNRAWLAWYLGEDDALARARDAVDHARALNDNYALAFALGIGAAIAQHAREPELVRDFAEECAALSAKQLLCYWQAWATVFAGWAEVQLGRPGGIERIARGRDDYLATGATQLNICALTLLAECHLAQGEPGRAEAVLRGVDPDAPGAGFYFLSEMWRVRAAASLALGDRVAAAAAIDQALAIARKQGSPALLDRAERWQRAELGPG